MAIRVFILAVLLLASPFLQVARCQPTSNADESGDLEIVNEIDETPTFGDEDFGPAAGVETLCVFPRNIAKSVPAGEETELLVGIQHNGASSISVVAIKASVHLPYDHRVLVQNLTAQVFNNASVPPSAQATFPYVFAVSKVLQTGTFDLVGTIVYEVDKQLYQSTFYNGTIEVYEPSAFVNTESFLLGGLVIVFAFAVGLWIRGRIQSLSKKSKRAPKVEVGTRSTDGSLDEWLEGTAYTQSNKSKKKK